MAEEYLAKSLDIAQASDMAEWTPVVKRTLGLTKLQRGELLEAQELFEEAHNIHSSMGDSSRAAITASICSLFASS